MKKYITLILIIYSTGVWAQDWTYTPFATTTPYQNKCKITVIGKVELKEGKIIVSGWSFDCTGSMTALWGEVKTNKGTTEIMVAGWTTSELKAIEDSANGITYYYGKAIDIGYGYDFKIESWYDPSGNSIDIGYGRDTVKPKVTNDTIYTPVPLYYEVKKGKTIFSMRKTKGSKLYTKPTTFYGIAGIKKQPIDSSKYFYRRFLKLKSQGVPDSLNKFKSKLYKNEHR